MTMDYLKAEVRRHLVKISCKQRSETVVSRIYKLLYKRAGWYGSTGAVAESAACRVVIRTVNSGLAPGAANLRCRRNWSKSRIQLSRVASTLRVRVRFRYARGRSPAVPRMPRACFFARECPRRVPEGKSKRKEITFGTDSLHYCPRKIYVFFFLFFSARATTLTIPGASRHR